MNNYHKASLVCTALSAAAMFVLFVVQATFQIEEQHQTITFRYGNIAFGYPQGQEGCKGGTNNSVVALYEDCDNGGGTGDGCSATCTVESGYTCTATVGSISVCSGICGDSLIKGSEGCDDGGTTSGNGCSSTCAVESGYTCSGTPSTCSTTCGDGTKAGSEACDDANTTAGDGCSATCTVQTGYSCTGTAPSVCATVCGDDVVAGSESCDPGGSGSTLTCNSDCTITSCGDSKINTAALEECDDGTTNNVSTKRCTSACKKTRCGDGILQTPNGYGQTEACEPLLDSTCTTGCSIATGVGGGTTVTRQSSSTATVIRQGPPPTCGNGRIDLDKGEQCDEGQFNGISPNCDRWCHTQFCGNAIVEKTNLEECEPLKLNDGTYEIPTCGKACTVPLCDAKGSCIGGCRWVFLPACSATGLNSGASSVSSEMMRSSSRSSTPFVSTQGASRSSLSVQSFILPSPIQSTEESSSSQSSSSASETSDVCGNAIVDTDEECDNGSDNSDTIANGCRSNCTQARCGDSVLDTAEQCDSGDSENILGNGCTPTCKLSQCGNDILEPGEECDDGPRNSDSKPDSCSTLCLLPHCGDSLVDPSFGEVCDNGLNNSGTKPNACRLNCVPSYCGDAVTDEGEQCDNGSANSDSRANACRISCKLASCGDRVIDAGEQCDDGPGGSKGCTVKCTELALHGAAPTDSASESDNVLPLFLFVMVLAGILMWRLNWMLRF